VVGELEYCGYAECSWELVREPTVKPAGKPDAGNPHVRFDERGWETGRRGPSVLAPNLDSTAGIVAPRTQDPRLLGPLPPLHGVHGLYGFPPFSWI
jgi:hypothetical protein